MKCDRCENEATVHEVTRKAGVTHEKHLCEKCAAQQGVAPAQESSPLAEMVAFAMSHPPVIAMPGGAEAGVAVCPACGMSFAEFKGTGNLGCPECYAAFEGRLAPLIERAHEGAARHVGKVPKRLLAGAGAGSEQSRERVLGDAAQRRERLRALRGQLDEAVRAEQYERAATLRDEIGRLSALGVIAAEEKDEKKA